MGIVAGLMLLLLGTGRAVADDTHYRGIPVGAHAIGLGGAFTGVADDNAIRLDGETNATYLARSPSTYWITTNFNGSNPHPGIADKTAAYRVLEWIDAVLGVSGLLPRVASPAMQKCNDDDVALAKQGEFL